MVMCNSDTSDENENTVRKYFPMEWYDDLPHIQFDMNGKIFKPLTKDALDKFLDNVDDVNSGRNCV
jgi:ribosome biogenesis protein ERB1